MAMCQLKECLRANIEFARKNLHVKGVTNICHGRCKDDKLRDT